MQRTIDRQKIRSLGGFEFLAKQAVEGFITGMHKSPFHGFSVEFAEHRLYNKGESTKHIDWKLYARTDKLFIKRYEEETNLRCQLVIDASSSMYFPSKDEWNKINFSAHAAAALAYLFRRQRDAVGLSFFSDTLELHTPAKSSLAHHRFIYSELEKVLFDFEPAQQKTTSVAENLHAIAENIIIGILVFSAIAWVFGLGKFYGVVSAPPTMTHLFAFDLGAALSASMVTVVFTLFFIDFFDTAGTLTSVANVAGKMKGNKIEDIDKAMLSDSVSTVAGAMMGTSTVTTYVESAAGVKAGGRTGMVSLTIGVLFLACLFISPLATSLPKEIDGAALIYIATLFLRNIKDIEWDDITEAGPAVLAAIAMPFTYSISHGIALGFISYAAVKILTGKTDTSPAIWIIAALSLVSFLVG